MPTHLTKSNQKKMFWPSYLASGGEDLKKCVLRSNIAFVYLKTIEFDLHMLQIYLNMLEFNFFNSAAVSIIPLCTSDTEVDEWG